MGRARATGLGSLIPSRVEVLERRRMLSAAPVPTLDAGGTLHVQGTDGRDVIVFSLRNHHKMLRVSVNGEKTDFNLSAVSGIEADGGGENDVLVMVGKLAAPATLNGSAGNDLIVSGTGDDEINGGDGNDKLFGGKGNDTMSGDAGDDQMHGGAGDDNMGGGDGNDTMLGDAGADVMLGGAGNDRMNAGTGDDQLSGADGDDDVSGGPGTDLVVGGDGHDTFHSSDAATEYYDKTSDDVVMKDHSNEKKHAHELHHEEKHQVPEVKTKK